MIDGAGEAKIDLIPESEFFQQLNNTVFPHEVKLHQIAGKFHPPEDFPFLEKMTDDFGDGAVSIESTWLITQIHNIWLRLITLVSCETTLGNQNAHLPQSR